MYICINGLHCRPQIVIGLTASLMQYFERITDALHFTLQNLITVKSVNIEGTKIFMHRPRLTTNWWDMHFIAMLKRSMIERIVSTRHAASETNFSGRSLQHHFRFVQKVLINDSHDLLPS
ncbi:hypothetical protein D3C77_618210 [compost metagenome]